ncbi:MAG: hypothetical protein H0T17_08580, partial [Propionibacteriales bacterium]|nr:hypothetical protein [Propionibacteriales bacterium]
GGDPIHVESIGVPGYLRTEGTDRSLHAYANGAVLTLSTRVDVAEQVEATTLAELMRLAIRRLPNNPVLKELTSPTRCTGVSDAAVTAALGRPPTLLQEFDAFGAVECSWGGQPGSVLVTMLESRRAVARSKTVVESAPFAPVPDIPGGYSSADKSGDLLVFRRARVYEITVVPAAGYFAGSVATTDGEFALAREVLTNLR